MNDETAFSWRHLWRVLVACGLVWFSMFVIFPPLFAWVGVQHYGMWFLDTYALLASSDAFARGLDPYVPNPLDVFHRPHVYSHWWLLLHKFGFSRSDNAVVGLILIASFFVVAVARLRSRDPADAFFNREQPLTWMLFGCLIAFLPHFTREVLEVIFRGNVQQTTLPAA